MSGTRERPGRADASKPTDTGKDWKPKGSFPKNRSQIKLGERNMTKYVDAIIRVSDSVLNAVGEFLTAPTTDKINPHLMDYAKTEYKNDWRWAYLYMVENQGKGPKSDR
tara:strand:+ start:5159 stop:5485 length:327 start_codon:yes stop_codon:yes gene_type:complete